MNWSSKLSGRIATNEEIELLRSVYGENIDFNAFEQFMLKNPIIGVNLIVDSEKDNSKIGVDMTWITPEEQAIDALEIYPECVAIKELFIPIGECNLGSGDPYFLKIEQGIFNVYRIRHDAVNEDDSLDSSGIEFVMPLEELIKR